MPCSAARQALQEQDESAALRHKAEQKEIDRVSASARRLATWGRVYDNEDLARKAKQMEKQVARLKDEQTELSVGPPWRLVLQGDALPSDRLLEMDTLPDPARAGPAIPLHHRRGAPAQRRSRGHHGGAMAAANRPCCVCCGSK
ncbi:hypothetical protein LNP20_07605 [Klebsiella pneumoniae subsp. pneumoniae]|nr:hypothetical protein [Klebsiella pneumoniae subsp. pneumoniae]